MSKNTLSSGRIGLAGLLTILFIILKLTNVVDWSWWWVFSPLWISALLVVAMLIGVVILGIIVSTVRGKE